MLFNLQTFALPGRNSWVAKNTALVSGQVTKTQWENLERFCCLAQTPNENIQKYIDSCTDSDAQALYAFAMQAADVDDLVIKQNKRDAVALTEAGAIKRLFETSIFKNVIIPERKNPKKYQVICNNGYSINPNS
jgi:hypothetical protein